MEAGREARCQLPKMAIKSYNSLGYEEGLQFNSSSKVQQTNLLGCGGRGAAVLDSLAENLPEL